MQIVVYDNIYALPGNGPMTRLSEVMLFQDDVDNEEGEEFKNFLLAIFSLTFPLTMHLYIERKNGRRRATVVRPVITTHIRNHVIRSSSPKVVWGTGLDQTRQGSLYYTSFNLDIDTTGLSDEQKKVILREKRSFSDWQDYFKNALEQLRQRSVAEMGDLKCIIPFLEETGSISHQ